MTTSLFLNDWAATAWSGATGIDSLKSDFAITDNDLAGVNIIVASYTYENYAGDAYVLFERAGALFEVHGRQCSCYGLKGQWEPDEITVEDLRANLDKSRSYCEQAACREHILAFVEAREAAQWTCIDKPYALRHAYYGMTMPFRIDKETPQKFIGAKESWDGTGWEERETRLDKDKVVARFYTKAGMKDAQMRAMVAYESHSASVAAARIALNEAEAAHERAWLAAMVEEGL